MMKKPRALVALDALAHETRLDIFRLLVARGPDGIAAGVIGERLGQPAPTLSFHLNQLRVAGLITARRASRSIIYAANFKTMNDLLAYLTENCCGGRPGLCFPDRAGQAASVCGESACASPSQNIKPIGYQLKDVSVDPDGVWESAVAQGVKRAPVRSQTTKEKPAGRPRQSARITLR